MVYFRFKILLMLGSQNGPSPAEEFQGGLRELGEINSCSQILCWTTGWATDPYCSMDHQVCSHVHGDYHRSDKTPGHPQHYLQLLQSASERQCNLSWAKPTDQHREGSTTHRRGETVQTELFTRFPASQEGVDRNTRNRTQSPPSFEAAAGGAPVLQARTPQGWHTRTTRHDDKGRTASVTAATRHPEITARQQTEHPESDNIAIHRCVLHYEPDGSRRKDILHSGWSRSHRPKTANINRKLYLIL